ncbi:hypothetical protein DFA_04370 [Cavenderia fasciculata]|uniref:Ankyrin repeat-containing protein n=1 Tax=Cavenderia fasciculata TaxID=261658 RepID=F4PPD9_CACFS|nr:uncharacterized protein DFA_04370 [Cavenderia fasciculata]EGG22252.1 hypothetical protein DFA_04370 [Cavenderia fasciculata]|eukprot:XP_004360103.1 hypothetical protein DFA_04370 [Cavenderia fasciculata]
MTSTTFHCIFRSIYIRHLIFNHISDISKQLNHHDGKERRSLKGRDIIKLPDLGMISRYAMPWNFQSHYLPKDIHQILPERRKRVINQYCLHRNATLDTLEHLLEWSTVIGFDWKYLKRTSIGDMRNQEILEYIIKRCPADGQNDFLVWALNNACMNGYLSTVKLIDSFKLSPLNGKPMETACCKGFIDIVKYLHENRTERCSIKAMDSAAIGNHLEVVKFLHFNRTEGCSKDALYFSSQHGHFEVVKFLHQHRSEFTGATTDAIDRAAENGHIDVVKFLHFNRSEGATTKAMDLAAQNGHIEIVKFLHFNRSEGATTKAMDWASKNGHTEIVKFLHFNRSEGCTSKALMYACERGNENFNQETLQTASIHGQFEIVKMILSQSIDKLVKLSIKSLFLKINSETDHFEVGQLLENHLKQQDNQEEECKHVGTRKIN